MFIRGSKLNLTLSHRLERKWKPFRIGSRAPPRFITEIAPRNGSPAIINLESKKTIESLEEESRMLRRSTRSPY